MAPWFGDWVSVPGIGYLGGWTMPGFFIFFALRLFLFGVAPSIWMLHYRMIPQ